MDSNPQQSTQGQQPGGQQVGPGRNAVGQQQGLADQIRNSLADLPLTAGAVFGAVAVLLPFGLLAGAALIFLDYEPLAAAASLFFVVAGFGSGHEIVRTYLRGASFDSLSAVDPSDYPSVETELANTIDLLQTNPDAALLLLYLLGPFVLYIGGRYLSRNYAIDGDLVDHATTGTAVVAGAFPLALVIGVVFGVDDLIGGVLVAGLVVPATIGALGGLSVFAFDEDTGFTSRITGWLGVAGGLVVTYLLFDPVPDRAAAQLQEIQQQAAAAGADTVAEELTLTVPQKLVGSIAGFLSTVQFEPGFGSQGTVILLAVALVTLLAGFLRAYLDREVIATKVQAAKLGARIVLGYATGVLFLTILLPLSTIVVTMPFSSRLFAAVLPTAADLPSIVLLGGVMFPAVLGAAGGYLSAMYLERQGRPIR
ncbi:hypothetical protein [Halorientalis sp. IM1011]|uniref:hypothetical protein n=1 Tax=Halorientalis sp. IM1011 TaxID=1932360 RepID=UPI0012F72611|nr:hypothetical protein [Halorientalis sp. IM1011]